MSDTIVWRGHSCPRNVSSEVAHSGNFYRVLVLVTLLAAMIPNASAQRSGSAASGHASPATHAGQHSGSTHRNYQSSPSRRNPYFSPYTSLPFPFFNCPRTPFPATNELLFLPVPFPLPFITIFLPSRSPSATKITSSSSPGFLKL